MLVMVQACTPPLLLAGPLGRKKLEPWRGILHSCNVVLAVLLSRFAIFDILQVRGQPPCMGSHTPGLSLDSRGWRGVQPELESAYLLLQSMCA